MAASLGEKFFDSTLQISVLIVLLIFMAVFIPIREKKRREFTAKHGTADENKARVELIQFYLKCKEQGFDQADDPAQAKRRAIIAEQMHISDTEEGLTQRLIDGQKVHDEVAEAFYRECAQKDLQWAKEGQAFADIAIIAHRLAFLPNFMNTCITMARFAMNKLRNTSAGRMRNSRGRPTGYQSSRQGQAHRHAG